MMDELTRAFLRYLDSRSLADLIHYYKGSIPDEIEIIVTTPSLKGRHVKKQKKENQGKD